MAILLMRLLYGVYFIGFWICFYHFISQALFAPETLRKNVSWQNFILVVFWPLALLSRPGRKQLSDLTKKIALNESEEK